MLINKDVIELIKRYSSGRGGGGTLNANLTALSALDATAGFLYQTGAATFTKYPFAGSGTALSVSHSDHTHSGVYATGSLSVGKIPYCSNATGPVLSDSPIFTDGTNVSIGTTQAVAKLHVKGGNDNTFDLDNDGSQYTYQYFRNNGNIKGSLGYDNTGNAFWMGADAVNVSTVIQSGNGSEAMRILSNGNVGIHTPSAGSILELYTSTAGNIGPTLTLNNPLGTAGAGSAIDFKGYSPATQPIQARIRSMDDTNWSSHITFWTKAQTSEGDLSEKVRIQSDGNFGIGYTAPLSALCVNGSVNIGSAAATTAHLNLMQTNATWAIQGEYYGTAHGVTDILPTDCPWGIIGGDTSGNNGINAVRFVGIAAYAGLTNALSIEGVIGSADHGVCVTIDGSKYNGATGRTSLTSGNAKLLSVCNNGSEQFSVGCSGVLSIQGNSMGMVDWTSSAGIGGFSSIDSHSKVFYKMIGKTVFLWFQIYGTSNNLYFTFVLPTNVKSFVSYPNVFECDYAVRVVDNSSNQAHLGLAQIGANFNSVEVWKDGANTAWTASATKGAWGFICYEAD